MKCFRIIALVWGFLKPDILTHKCKTRNKRLHWPWLAESVKRSEKIGAHDVTFCQTARFILREPYVKIIFFNLSQKIIMIIYENVRNNKNKKNNMSVFWLFITTQLLEFQIYYFTKFSTSFIKLKSLNFLLFVFRIKFWVQSGSWSRCRQFRRITGSSATSKCFVICSQGCWATSTGKKGLKSKTTANGQFYQNVCLFLSSIFN
jgi:hypothetical protein